MSTFGKELRKIRESKELTQKVFSEQLGMKPGTYHAVETGKMGSHTKSAQRILQSNALSKKERQRLGKFAQIKAKKNAIKITKADRLAYQRRKNAQYRKELTK